MANTDLEKGLQKAIDAKDSIGGIVECRVNNLPLGLGEPFFDSAESLLAHAVFAIPAVKGIEFGAGFAAAKMFGSEHNDAIEDATGKTKTNHAGGIVGGITNGNELVFRIAIKPTSSTPKEQQTLNWETNHCRKFFCKRPPRSLHRTPRARCTRSSNRNGARRFNDAGTTHSTHSFLAFT